MARIEHVDFGFGHIAAIGVRFGKLEGQVVLPPEDEQPRLLLVHPSLPFGVGVDVGAVVVEEVALNVSLAGLVEKSKLIGPEIGVIAIPRWNVMTPISGPMSLLFSTSPARDRGHNVMIPISG